MDPVDKYEAVIGLEVHAQMKTKSKAFCSCSTEYHSEPNTNVCPVCLGHPGTLPVLNKKLVEFIVKLGIAANCRIQEQSIFARKNYFYPDLPKGYQISQFETPICDNGSINIYPDNTEKKIGITRIHMEEDAGKSLHDVSDEHTLVDLNRCGVPLIEIVSEPDMRTSKEAYQYLTKLKQLVQYLDICDANMEEGSLRCDANVSVRLKGETKLNTKTEVKNLNSFKNASDALDCEIKRQVELYEKGEKVIHQTLTYDAKSKKTIPMRSKEEAHDYRYFPEPDLVKITVNKEWQNQIKSGIGELPEMRLNRFETQYSLPGYDSEVLTQDKIIGDYFEKVCINLQNADEYKTASNLMMTEVMRYLNDNKIKIDEFKINDINFAKLVRLLSENQISHNISKVVFTEMLAHKSDDKLQDPENIVKEKNLSQVSDESEIEEIINRILESYPNEVNRYKSGETKLTGFFVGKIMKESKGKANPKKVNEILERKLK